MSEIRDALDRLPDRDLRPDEALTAASALGAQALSRITYDTEDGEVRCLMTFLWFDQDPVGLAASLSHDESGHDLEALGRCPHSSFMDAVEDTAQRFGVEVGQGEIVKLDESGNVVNSRERNL